jgi:signal transduction histidine kinase
MADREESQFKTSENNGGPAEKSSKDDSVTLGLLGKSVIDALPVGIVVFGSDLRIVEANRQAAKLIKLGDYIDESLAQGTDGICPPGLNWTELLNKVLATGTPHDFESLNYTLAGKTRRLRIGCTPLTTEGNENPGGAIMIEDVTEVLDMQRQLASAERLATVGRLASKVAHELNNPMDGILRYINLAMRSIERRNFEKPKEYLTQCRQGLMRMVKIVGELLEFSRTTHASLEYARIEQLIDDALRTMSSITESSKVRISRDYCADLPQMRNGNLFQVFCNLIKNAVEAMPHGGQLTISTRRREDNSAVVEFRDTGPGLPAESTNAIFEPFFTTKDKGRGTGLGLAICKDIVERYNGRITAENAPEGGAIFTVYLPLASNP